MLLARLKSEPVFKAADTGAKEISRKNAEV